MYILLNMDIHPQIIDINFHKYLQFIYIYPLGTCALSSVYISLS